MYTSHRVGHQAVSLLCACAVFLAALYLPFPASAQGSVRVGLVVDPGDGTLITQIVDLSQPDPTGYDVLQQSGLEILAHSSAMGVAICSIAGTGCPASDCFCQSPQNSWTYWHMEDGAWVYSLVGASSYRVEDGAVEGWRWGSGDPPPVLTFSQIAQREAGGLSAQQAYPGPETPVALPTYEPYPGPEDTPAVPLPPYPGPEEPTEATGEDGQPTLALEPATPEPSVTARSTATVSPGLTASLDISTSRATATPRTSLTPGAGDLTRQPAVVSTPATATATPDRVAILIATGVAQEKATVEAERASAAVPGQSSYAGFAVLAIVLLLLVGYVYLLRHQRRLRIPPED